jgi:hypothetical protein
VHAQRKEVGPRELIVLAIGACALSIAMHWPLVLNLGDAIPKDLGDPLVQTWQAAWGGHALWTQPGEFFQSNQFWPLDDTLALSDALIGYAPFGPFGSGVHAAVVRYDLLFLFAYALAFAGAYLLARELGVGPLGALVAGAAFAFAPFRLEQDGHLHVISSGGIPLAFALGLRGYRLGRPSWVIAGWLVASWELSLGWTLGLPLAYLILTVLAVLVVIWIRRGRPPIPRRLVVATAVGGVVFAATAAALAQPYLRVADEHPEARRSPETVEVYSPPAQAFVVAPEENQVWGGPTAGLRDSLRTVPEQTLFPGLVILALAVVGLGSAGYGRGLRIGLAVGVLAFSVLALGFTAEGGLLYPYRWVYELLPGWEAIRVPGRLVTFSSLALALLAAAGADRLAASLGARFGSRLAVAGAVALALLVAVEGRGLPFDPFDRQAQPRVPNPPTRLGELAGPQLHLPAQRPEDNRRYLLWSTDEFPELVNGRSSTNPTFTRDLIEEEESFPDRASVARLRELGVRTVVLHPRRAVGTPWEGADRVPVARLPLVRDRRGRTVIYEIEPPSSAGSPVGTAGEPRSPRKSR